MRGAYHQSERQCAECGESFWGTEAARFCSKACGQRARRAMQPSLFGRGNELAEVCRAFLSRSGARDLGASKLLPRLFRATARELRLRGWDPIELLMTRPDEPASADDVAPGGIEGEAPARRRWLFPPEVEIEKLEALVVQRKAQGHPVGWHLERIEQIREYLIARDADERAARSRERA